VSETEIGAPRSALLMRLRDEKDAGVRGGVYHRLQVEMTYNSRLDNVIDSQALAANSCRLEDKTGLFLGQLRTLNVIGVVGHLHLYRSRHRMRRNSYRRGICEGSASHTEAGEHPG